MAHMIEALNGKVNFAYTGEKPWHGLGVEVADNLSPSEIMTAAGLDWTVQLAPMVAKLNGQELPTKSCALVRDVDSKVLDVVSDDWHPTQNAEAFAFFNEFIATGGMKMETAGSLKGGQVVFALARVSESFEALPNDRVDSFLLFTNPHKYGQSIDVRCTPVRVVCNNTLSMAISQTSKNAVKVSHRIKFDEAEVKTTMGFASKLMAKYAEEAKFLASRRASNEDVMDYFTRLFPMNSVKDTPRSEVSKNATLCAEILMKQPGADIAAGTWWNAFNAVTFATDHIIGRNADNRVHSAWYGQNKILKQRAMDLALGMAG